MLLARSITHSLDKDAWIIDHSNHSLLEILNHFHMVEIQSSTRFISLSRVATFPEFILVGTSLCAPEHGVSFSEKEITSTHLSSGYKNHRDLSLCIQLEDEFVRLSFNATDSHLALLSKLTQKVTAVRLAAELSNTKEQCDQTCPCCLEEKRKIRQSPQLHPLYHLLNHFAQRMDELCFNHTGINSSSNLSIIPESIHAAEGIAHLYSSTQHLAIDLTEVYNVRVQLDETTSSTSTLLKAYNSFGDLIFTITQEGSEGFRIWNSILQSPQSKQQA